jgi:hypothetical protein
MIAVMLFWFTHLLSAQTQQGLTAVLAQIASPVERRAIETALAAENLLDGRICGAGRLPVNNGTHTLFVVTINEGRLCNTVAIVRASPNPEVIQMLDTWADSDQIEDVLRDLDNDGEPEIVLRHLLTGGGTGSSVCTSVIPIVYKCDSMRCTDRSRQFVSLYWDQLAAVRNQLADFQSSGDIEHTKCATIERDKILRVLGQDSLAGLAAAREWASSPDKDTREKALAVAEDIDDRQATQLLEKLQNDDDQLISERAVRALRGRQRR